jgi:hypothetical protein
MDRGTKGDPLAYLPALRQALRPPLTMSINLNTHSTLHLISAGLVVGQQPGHTILETSGIDHVPFRPLYTSAEDCILC